MYLGKPQLHAKFEVAGFIYYGNIRVSVFKRQICFYSQKRQIGFLSHRLKGVTGNIRTSSIGRWKAH